MDLAWDVTATRPSPDVTSERCGEFSALHNLRGLGTLEINPNSAPGSLLQLRYRLRQPHRLGQRRDDHARRTHRVHSARDRGRPGCACTATPTAADFAAGGNVGRSLGGTGPRSSRLRFAVAEQLSLQHRIQPRLQRRAPPATIPAAPAEPRTRNVQEITGGYWYDIYRGDHGRLRQSLQYSYAETYRLVRCRRHRRQGHRQHVLDVVPLLPAVNQTVRLSERGSLSSAASSFCNCLVTFFCSSFFVRLLLSATAFSAHRSAETQLPRLHRQKQVHREGAPDLLRSFSTAALMSCNAAAGVVVSWQSEYPRNIRRGERLIAAQREHRDKCLQRQVARPDARHRDRER